MQKGTIPVKLLQRNADIATCGVLNIKSLILPILQLQMQFLFMEQLTNLFIKN